MLNRFIILSNNLVRCKHVKTSAILPHLNTLANRCFSGSLSYDKVSDETLDSLAEKFEDLMSCKTFSKDGDVTFSDGVLYVDFGKEIGTYVINKQSPNQQLWLSSPSSGPKRYDFLHNTWVYKHDGNILHELLTTEVSQILDIKTDFSECAYGRKE